MRCGRVRGLGCREERSSERGIADHAAGHRIEPGELAQIDREGFLRDHVALISWRALSCQLKGDFSTLSVRLIQNGVITLAQLQEAEAMLS